MSEYQYYEFQAIDRPLTDEEMDYLRTFSSRATINSHQFRNEYSWGSFKGDEDEWVEKYFDAFLYNSNWGTRVLKFALPSQLLNEKIVQSYLIDSFAEILIVEDRAILSFLLEDEEGGEWNEGIELAPFLSLRSSLIKGDLRFLYLGWLLGIRGRDDNEIEPPVPPGLQALTPALKAFIEFFQIDLSIVEAAAQASAPLGTSIDESKVDSWVINISVAEKNKILAQVLEGALRDDRLPSMKLCHRFTSEVSDTSDQVTKRTVGEILGVAKAISTEKNRLKEERAALEKAEKQRQLKLERENRLNEIKGKESTLWAQIDDLISQKNSKSYDEAIRLLIDLEELSTRENDAQFVILLKKIHERHRGKSSFVRRLVEQGLLT